MPAPRHANLGKAVDEAGGLGPGGADRVGAGRRGSAGQADASPRPRSLTAWLRLAWQTRSALGLTARNVTIGLSLVLLLGGYVALDVHDVVPGFLTRQAPHIQPAPFPQIAGMDNLPDSHLVLPAAGSGPVQFDAADVQGLVAALAADERMAGNLSVLVVDAVTGDTLGSYGSHLPVTPASTLKTLTGLAVAYSIDWDSTLDTRTVLMGEDTVVLVGGGDMMLASGSGNPEAVHGRAGLGDLAAATAQALGDRGISQVRLVLDDSLFAAPFIQDTVPASEVAAGFVGPVAALAVNVGLQGTDAYQGQGTRFEDPALVAAQRFALLLEEHGITVTDAVERSVVSVSLEAGGQGGAGRGQGQGSDLGQGLQELAVVHSASIGEITQFALLWSDNTLTELLGRLVAVHTGGTPTAQGAIEAVSTTVTRLGLDLEGSTLADLSGLARDSRLTARLLVDVAALSAAPGSGNLRHLALSNPIAGMSGSLANRFTGDDAGRGFVRAKTGTLPGVVGLAGTVVTQGQRLLLFAVIADDIDSPFDARIAIDSFVNQLVAVDGLLG